MIANREMSLEDYLAIGRRQFLFVLIPVLIGPLLGLLISYAFTPKYTSLSLLLVEPQVVPAGYVKPMISERVRDRMVVLETNVLSRSRLHAMVDRLGLVKPGGSEEALIDTIRANIQVIEADPEGGSARAETGADAAGFFIRYTADNPQDAQQVCAEITSMLLTENLMMRQQTAQDTTDFISRQLEQAKQNLDSIDQKLSEFKASHFGQLPSDQETNFKVLSGLSSQMDATTQALSRTQQDKSYAESLLTQQLAAWKAVESTPNVPTIRQRILTLENQLAELKSRYTEDHPDVAKLERDIQQLKDTIKKMNADPDADPAPEGLRAKMEPPDVMRLRQQIRQNEILIARLTREQERLQKSIDLYQSRVTVSPEIEEQWKQLTRDVETAHAIYNNLLTNENTARMQTEMEHKQQGEQVKLVNPASLPTLPSFPVRIKFAAAGLGGGLALGLCFAFWRELQDKGMRDEQDVLAALRLPMLASVPAVRFHLQREGAEERALTAVGSRRALYDLSDKMGT